jgi:hypothetical protein
MIYPNKHITFEESIIFKMLSILELKKGKEESIRELYQRVSQKFTNIDEFIYALDVLYLLDKIDINFEKETIIYAF